MSPAGSRHSTSAEVQGSHKPLCHIGYVSFTQHGTARGLGFINPYNMFSGMSIITIDMSFELTSEVTFEVETGDGV